MNKKTIKYDKRQRFQSSHSNKRLLFLARLSLLKYSSTTTVGKLNAKNECSAPFSSFKWKPHEVAVYDILCTLFPNSWNNQTHLATKMPQKPQSGHVALKLSHHYEFLQIWTLWNLSWRCCYARRNTTSTATACTACCMYRQHWNRLAPHGLLLNSIFNLYT